MKKNQGRLVAVALLLAVVLIGATSAYRILSEKYSATPETVQAEEMTEGESVEVEGVESETTASETEESTEDQVVEAIDFSMTDENGEKVNLSDFYGKPVVMNFWATWCGPCQSEMPHFDKAYQQYKDQINFLMIDLTDGARDTVESASAFVEEQGYSFPILFDTEYEGASTYGINSIPTTFFINARGEIEAYQIGALTEEVLFNQLEIMVNEDSENA